MNTHDSYKGISRKIDVWDGLDDVDLEPSITYNTLNTLNNEPGLNFIIEKILLNEFY